jgi:hypothetical protein
MAERTLVSRSGQVPGDNGGMLAIVLALAAAIVYGGSDFTAGLAMRGASVIQVTLIASVVAAAALAWGLLAGAAGTAGAFALYLGFRHAAFSVAGPLSAVGAAGFSVLAGLLMGERLTRLRLTGLALAAVCVALIAAGGAG